MSTPTFVQVDRSVADLAANTINPRTLKDKAFKELKESLDKDREFIKARPIIVSMAEGRENTVIAGNMRLQAIKSLGWATVPVVEVRDASVEQEKEWMVKDNLHKGEWDFEKLADNFELDFLKEMGFDEKGLNKVLAGMDNSADDEFDAEKEVEAITEPVVKRGDIWQLGEHRLMCGDSTDAGDVALLMDGKKVELLFTSPPYADMREYGGSDLSVEKLSDFIPVFDPFCEYQVVNLGIKRQDHEIVQYWDCYIAKAKSAGLKLMAWNVWAKTYAGSVGQQSAFIPIAHEWLFVFGRIFKDINRTEERKTKTGIKNDRSRRQADGSMKTSSIGVEEELKEMESVFFNATEMGTIRKDHPAIFPAALPEKYIKSISSIGDAVVDPFCGSGTTLIACENLKRVCYGMEIDPKYCDVIIKRWEEKTGKKASKSECLNSYERST